MQCSFPPPLTEDQITAALDGETSTEVQDHLSRCPACAIRLADARKVEQMLAGILYRWNCPSSQQLGNYHFGLASEDEANTIRQHVEQCVHCQAELSGLDVFLASNVQPNPPPPRPSLTLPRPGEIIGRLLSGPAMPALRGADSGPVMMMAGDETIFLEVQRTAAGRELSGQLASDHLEVWEGALATLRQSGELLATMIVDDLGAFHCLLPSSGAVDLRITSASGLSIVLNDTDLGG